MFAPHTDPSPVTQVGQRGSSLDRRSNRVFSFPAPIPAGCPGHSPYDNHATPAACVRLQICQVSSFALVTGTFLEWCRRMREGGVSWLA